MFKNLIIRILDIILAIDMPFFNYLHKKKGHDKFFALKAAAILLSGALIIYFLALFIFKR